MSLNELLERATIEFPKPINAREFEKSMIPYIYFNLNSKKGKRIVRIFYSSRVYHEFSPEMCVEETTEIKGKINFSSKRSRVVSHSSCEFEMERAEEIDSFKGMRFFIPPGYDSVEEFESLLPSGKAQIVAMDTTKRIIEDYFAKNRSSF